MPIDHIRLTYPEKGCLVFWAAFFILISSLSLDVMTIFSRLLVRYQLILKKMKTIDSSNEYLPDEQRSTSLDLDCYKNGIYE